jgi:hypothetical protein
LRREGTPPATAVAILEPRYREANKPTKFREFMQGWGLGGAPARRPEGFGSAEISQLIDSENKAMGDVAASLGMARK